MAVALQEIYIPDAIHTYQRPQLSEQPSDYVHEQVVFTVNKAVQQHLDIHREISEKPFPPYAVEEGKRLIAGITAARAEVKQLELTPQADMLRATYTQADLLSLGKSTKERVIERIKTLGTSKRHLTSDIDETITVGSTGPDSYLTRLIPASSIGERILQEHGGNRKVFPYAFAMTWQHGLRQVPHAYREAGKQVAIREGVRAYLAYEKEKGNTVKANSANFIDFALGVLDQMPEAEGMQVHAVDVDDLTAVDKGTNLTRDALLSPNRATFFAGDGGSDEVALEAREYVTCYFALEGGGFEKKLKEAKLASGEPVAYLPYKTYHDILAYMQEFDVAMTSQEQLVA